ncbi:MAG: hypothetical protein J6K25_10620 [Thermoguttaceae bacterium]|nr:hypothetical protein [Thermoguttaceae bacterium]
MTEEKRVKKTSDEKLEFCVSVVVDVIESLRDAEEEAVCRGTFPQDRGVRPCCAVFERVASDGKLPPATVFRALPRYQKYESGTVVIERGKRGTEIWQTVITFVAEMFVKPIYNIDRASQFLAAVDFFRFWPLPRGCGKTRTIIEDLKEKLGIYDEEEDETMITDTTLDFQEPENKTFAFPAGEPRIGELCRTDDGGVFLCVANDGIDSGCDDCDLGPGFDVETCSYYKLCSAFHRADGVRVRFLAVENLAEFVAASLNEAPRRAKGSDNNV